MGSIPPRSLWDATDWDLPASAFRPDPHAAVDPASVSDAASGGRGAVIRGRSNHPARTQHPAASGPTTSSGGHHRRRRHRAIAVRVHQHPRTTHRPLQPRPRRPVRDLAQQPGTLFYRLLTDEAATSSTSPNWADSPPENSASPSNSGTAPAPPRAAPPGHRCDLDHLIPGPQGPPPPPTRPKCRNDHRAKPTPDTPPPATATSPRGQHRPDIRTPPPISHSPSNNSPDPADRCNRRDQIRIADTGLNAWVPTAASHPILARHNSLDDSFMLDM